MARAYTTAKVMVLPQCDICGAEAAYDGKTVAGPWAFMCGTCYKTYGVGLGLGRGQRLVVASKGSHNNAGQKGDT